MWKIENFTGVHFGNEFFILPTIKVQVRNLKLETHESVNVVFSNRAFQGP